MRRYFKKLHLLIGGGIIFLSLSFSASAYADEATPAPSDSVQTPVAPLPGLSQTDGQTATVEIVSTSLLSGTPSPTPPSSGTTSGSSGTSDPSLTVGQQSSLSPTSTPLSETQSPQPDLPTVASVSNKIETANVALSTAVGTASSEAVSSASTQVSEAQTAISEASSALGAATTAAQAVVTQTGVVATANAAVESATATVTSTTNAVTVQTGVVATATTNLTNAQNTLTTLQNTPSDSKTYTTEGYVAPVAPETPTVTTTTLPAMYDGATKIQTPFDIKMGNTVYEGQGNASQIYVTSKATITFGTGDYNWWDFPNGPSISVFGSDFQSAGPNAGITVTTTETTLAVDWDLHLFGNPGSPITNVNWTMTVNPTTGEWTGVGTVAGNTTQLYNGPRIGVREVAGQAVKPMTNVTNSELTSQIQNQTAVVADKTIVKTTAVATLATLTTAKQEAVTALGSAQTTLTNETTTLTTLQSEKVTALNTANQLADDATLAVSQAVQAIQAYVPPAPPTPAPQPQQPSEPTPVVDPVPSPPAPEVVPPELPPIPDPTTDQQPDEPPLPPDPIPSENPDSPDVPIATPDPDGSIGDPTQPEPEQPQDPAPEPAPEPEPEPAPEPAPEPELNPSPEPPVDEPSVSEEVTAAVEDLLSDGKLSADDREKLLDALNADGEISKEEVNSLSDALSADGKLTTAEKELVAEALIQSVASGETLTKEQIQDAGIAYQDLPPATPVEVRQDENGNEVIITADVAAALVLLENPSELVGAIFSDPREALQALGSIGADMSPEEREEAEKMVVAAVIAGSAAMNAVGAAAAATGGSTGGSTGGGGSSGGGGASGDSKGIRRRKP